MSSNDTDRVDAQQRAASIDRALQADREGRDRLAKLADQPAPPRDPEQQRVVRP